VRWQVLVDEMAKRHDWATVLLVYSPRHPRPFRVAAITTAMLSLMFTNALLFK
jgi:hypothetical protein